MGRRLRNVGLGNAGVWGATAVAASWASLTDDRVQAAERVFATGIHRRRRAANDVVIAAATDLGSVYGLAGVGTALLVTGRRRAAVELVAAGSVAWVLAQSAKPLARRPRPYEAGEVSRLVAIPSGSSWPSGHTAVAAAMASAIGSHGHAPARVAGTGLTGFVGLSRVYVGVHYPTDVLAGAGIGMVSWQVVRGARRLVARRRRR